MAFVNIQSEDEYEYCIKRGFEPLADKRFALDPELRQRKQKERFKTDEDFYKFCWSVYPHYCEETGRPLLEYSASYISHILTRGAHPDMRYDPRNVNILCYQMHEKWEFGNRKEMRIYERNQKIINQLKAEYKCER